MDINIGDFKAKSHLFRLLRAVARGERFTITVRGRPVTDLLPHPAEMAWSAETAQGVASAVAALQSLPRIQDIDDAEVAAFVREGRL